MTHVTNESTTQRHYKIQHKNHTLWYEGDLHLLSLPCISIIGTRQPTPDGIRQTQYVAATAVDHGLCIISGLATGIDTAAHETSLQNNGSTIAVMGTPIDECYPKENAPLKERIIDHGLVISQFPPQSKSRRSNFPKRNALMAELSALTIVTEAGARSGTRHQVKSALRFDKKVVFLASIAEKNYPWITEALNSGNGFVIEETSDLAALFNTVATPTHPAVAPTFPKTTAAAKKRNTQQQLTLAMDRETTQELPHTATLVTPAPSDADKPEGTVIDPAPQSALVPGIVRETTDSAPSQAQTALGFLGRWWNRVLHLTGIV